MSRTIIKQLKALKQADINPREEWLSSHRALLLSQIQNTVHTERRKKSTLFRFADRLEEVFLHSSIKLVRPVAFVLLLAIAGITGRVATTQASQALPGDVLYGLKRTAENTQVALASVVYDENKLVKLHLELANRRADEVKEVIKKNPERKEAAKAAVHDLQAELQTANQKLGNLQKKPLSDVKTTVMTTQQTTDAIKKTLQEVKSDLQTSTSSIDKSLSDEVAAAKDLAKEASVATVKVAVESHLKGELSKEDVTKVIDTTLQGVVADTSRSKQTVAGVKEAVIQLTTSTNVTTTITTTTISLVASETKQAALQTEAAGEHIEQKVNEVKALVAKGENLTQVIDKVKEAADASVEAEKISNQTLEKVQTLIPQVQVIKTAGSTSTVTSTPGVTTSTTSSSIKSSSSSTSSAASTLPNASSATITPLFKVAPPSKL